jgi:hypothetical protein
MYPLQVLHRVRCLKRQNGVASNYTEMVESANQTESVLSNQFNISEQAAFERIRWAVNTINQKVMCHNQ